MTAKKKSGDPEPEQLELLGDKLKALTDHVGKPPPEPRVEFHQCPRCGLLMADCDDDWASWCPDCGTAMVERTNPVTHARGMADRRLSTT